MYQAPAWESRPQIDEIIYVYYMCISKLGWSILDQPNEDYSDSEGNLCSLNGLWTSLVTWYKTSLFSANPVPKLDLKACALETGEPLKYVWLNLAVKDQSKSDETNLELKIDDWLNIVDESAALGANSMVISPGNDLFEHTGIWSICQWAQSIHGMHVGVHIEKSTLSETELAQLSKLDGKLTCLVVDKTRPEVLETLNAYGIPIISSEIDEAICHEECTGIGHAGLCRSRWNPAEMRARRLQTEISTWKRIGDPNARYGE